MAKEPWVGTLGGGLYPLTCRYPQLGAMGREASAFGPLVRFSGALAGPIPVRRGGTPTAGKSAAPPTGGRRGERLGRERTSAL